MTFILTPLASYDFTTKPNANPLDPAFWSLTPVNPGVPTAQIGNLQVVSAACQGVSLTDNGGNSENFTPSGVNWPINQYAEIKLSALTGTSEVGVYILAAPDVTSYYMVDFFDNGDGTVDFEILKGLSDYTVDSLFENVALPFTASDTWRIVYFNGTIYGYQNGVLIGQASDSSYTSGVPGLFMLPVTNLANAQVVSFVAGSVASTVYSIPDDRNFSVFPNNSVNVQGTLTYTVPAHPSIIPPVDSRTTVPTDSRVAPIVPQNSRVAP